MSEADQLRSELSRLRDMSRWRDISTAPKDGTEEVLLGWFELPGMSMMRVGFWHQRMNAWCDTHQVLHNQHSFPTHWMPLPDAPEVS